MIEKPRFCTGRQPRRWWLTALAVCPLLAAAAYDAARVLEAAAARGPRVAEQAQALVQQIERSSTQDELQRLREVNDFFNRRRRLQDDAVTWGVPDYWATPLETLGKRRGDCEDYAIAKYYTLRPRACPAKLRLVYVRRTAPPAQRWRTWCWPTTRAGRRAADAGQPAPEVLPARSAPT